VTVHLLNFLFLYCVVWESFIIHFSGRGQKIFDYAYKIITGAAATSVLYNNTKGSNGDNNKNNKDKDKNNDKNNNKDKNNKSNSSDNSYQTSQSK